MATDKPVQLAQKVQYLIDKISKKDWQVRNSDDFEIKLNFVQYIDISIDKIINLDKKTHNSLQKKNDDGNKDNMNKLYSQQKQRLQLQKIIVQYQKKQLQKKSHQAQYQTMKLKLANKQMQVEKSKKIIQKQKLQTIIELNSQKQKSQFLRQQIEKLSTLNTRQQQQMYKIKQQRNNAQKREIQLRQKYENQRDQVQKLQQRYYKFNHKNFKGLRHTHTFVNVQNQKSSFQKYLTLELPVCIQVLKIVYGIKIGIQTANKEILYYDNLHLYEKQAANIQLDGNTLVVYYKKRKNNNELRLDNYKIHKPEIVVLLFGKGDGILVHQS